MCAWALGDFGPRRLHTDEASKSSRSRRLRRRPSEDCQPQAPEWTWASGTFLIEKSGSSIGQPRGMLLARSSQRARAKGAACRRSRALSLGSCAPVATRSGPTPRPARPRHRPRDPGRAVAGERCLGLLRRPQLARRHYPVCSPVCCTSATSLHVLARQGRETGQGPPMSGGRADRAGTRNSAQGRAT